MNELGGDGRKPREDGPAPTVSAETSSPFEPQTQTHEHVDGSSSIPNGARYAVSAGRPDRYTAAVAATDDSRFRLPAETARRRRRDRHRRNRRTKASRTASATALDAAGDLVLGHLFEHVHRRFGPHLRWIRSLLRCHLFGGGDVHFAVPRNGAFSPDAAIRRLFELPDLPADAVHADRHVGRGNRDGLSHPRPQSAVRHRHFRAVSRPGPHADLHRDRYFQRESRRVPGHRLRTRRTAVVQNSGPTDPRPDPRRLRTIHRSVGIRRLGGPVDHRAEPVSDRSTRRRPHPIRTAAPPCAWRGDGHFVGCHGGGRLVRAVGLVVDALFADVDGTGPSAHV